MVTTEQLIGNLTLRGQRGQNGNEIVAGDTHDHIFNNVR